jgi:hypothetical protein
MVLLNLIEQMLEKVKSINKWHYLWIGVIISEIFTAIASAAESYLLWGHLSSEVMTVGVIDAFLVPLVVVSIAIVFVSESSKLKQE